MKYNILNKETINYIKKFLSDNSINSYFHKEGDLEIDINKKVKTEGFEYVFPFLFFIIFTMYFGQDIWNLVNSKSGEISVFLGWLIFFGFIGFCWCLWAFHKIGYFTYSVFKKQNKFYRYEKENERVIFNTGKDYYLNGVQQRR